MIWSVDRAGQVRCGPVARLRRGGRLLPPGARLRRSADFARAVRRGRSAGRPSLIVHLWTDGADADTGVKVGFIVSKQVGTAVQRHQVTRRLRHLAAARIARLPESSLMVVRARPGAAQRPFSELGRDLDRALDRLVGGPR